MLKTSIPIAFVIVSLWGCFGTKPEYVVPHSGEAACTCSTVCACGLARDETAQQEHDRCKDACKCDKCPYEE